MISSKVQDGLKGSPIIPGDKSISHRSIIIPSISNGECEIDNLLKSDDVLHTLNAFKQMGVRIENINETKIKIYGKGLNSLTKSSDRIYLGNSGTSARLLTGLLANQKFNSIIYGDKSLSNRPMKRISDPLSQMGARINTNNGCLPIEIVGSNLKSTSINILVPSAQIKSGVILAALNTPGITEIIENKVTRDHTEIMLEDFGANINVVKEKNKKIIKINGQKELTSKNINVPSDLSSCAFFIVAALINKNSNLLIKNININPTRTGILLALEKMGARIEYHNKRTSNSEPICDIEVKSSFLKGYDFDSSYADLMIDEYPILSIAASFANSPSIFRGLSELRIKESDRLELIRLNLSRCGVNCRVEDNNLFINPSNEYKIINNNIQTDFDHRIAMSFAVMGSKIGLLNINESDSINTSFPTFKKVFNEIGGRIS